MKRLIAGLLVTLAVLAGAGCVVYDPGYHGYRGYHAPRYYYQGPPIHFRFHYYRGWRGMYQEYDPMEPLQLVDYEDAPPMCVDPGYVEPDQG